MSLTRALGTWPFLRFSFWRRRSSVGNALSGDASALGSVPAAVPLAAGLVLGVADDCVVCRPRDRGRRPVGRVGGGEARKQGPGFLVQVFPPCFAVFRVSEFGGIRGAGRVVVSRCGLAVWFLMVDWLRSVQELRFELSW